jgi:hypothetical protein
MLQLFLSHFSVISFLGDLHSGGFSFFLNEFLQQNLSRRHTNWKTQLDPRSYCCSMTTTPTMLSNQDNKISHPSSHSRPESSSPKEGKQEEKKMLSSSTSSPPAPPPLTTTTATTAPAAKFGERIRNKKTHNKGHILDRQIKHASEFGTSDQISQWTVKIWTVGIRQ